MTNSRTIAGAALLTLLPLTLAAVALEPVQAATTCSAGSMMIGNVCTNLATGEVSNDCKPSLA